MVRLVPLSATALSCLVRGQEHCEGLLLTEGALVPPQVLATLLDVTRAMDSSASVAWLIADKDTAVGMVSFTRFASSRGVISQDERNDFGYVVAPARRQQGVATKAVAAFVQLARRHGLTILTAETDRRNAASERVLIKNGFELVKASASSADSNLNRWSLMLQ